MNQQVINGLLITRPTRQDIESLQVGDIAPNCFGKNGIVKEIIYRGKDINGKAYVGYYVTWHDADSRISESLKEDEVLSTIPLSNKCILADFYRKI